MARAVATVEDFEAGTLPSVCAKTGEVAEGFTSITVTSTPSWTWILLLFGILPFLIAQAFSSTRIVGLVPMSEVAMRRTHAFTWTYRGFLVIGAAVLAVGLATDSTVLVLGVGILGAAILFTCIGWLFVWPTGRLSGEWVWLSFVDKRFASELDRWYGDS